MKKTTRCGGVGTTWARVCQAAEAEIPKGLRYTNDWSERMVTRAEAELLECRRRVSAAVGIAGMAALDAEGVSLSSVQAGGKKVSD